MQLSHFREAFFPICCHSAQHLRSVYLTSLCPRLSSLQAGLVSFARCLSKSELLDGVSPGSVVTRSQAYWFTNSAHLDIVQFVGLKLALSSNYEVVS